MNGLYANIRFLYGSNPDVLSLGTNNGKVSCQTRLVYYFIVISVATCFDLIGSKHVAMNQLTVSSFIGNWFIVKA